MASCSRRASGPGLSSVRILDSWSALLLLRRKQRRNAAEQVLHHRPGWKQHAHHGGWHQHALRHHTSAATASRESVQCRVPSLLQAVWATLPFQQPLSSSACIVVLSLRRVFTRQCESTSGLESLKRYIGFALRRLAKGFSLLTCLCWQGWAHPALLAASSCRLES